MKERVYKKLCKKSAEIMNFENCEYEQGIYYKLWHCGYDSEWDSEDCWPWLKEAFNSDVNTVIDENSECGLSWVGESQHVTPTPKNVFKWARDSY